MERLRARSRAEKVTRHASGGRLSSVSRRPVGVTARLGLALALCLGLTPALREGPRSGVLPRDLPPDAVPRPSSSQARLPPPEIAPGAFILHLEGDAPATGLAAQVSGLGARVSHELRLGGTRLSVRDVPPGGEKALARLPGVVRVSRDYVVRGQLAQSTPLVGALVSNYQMRNTAGGLGISVCVLDSGINRFHTMFDDDNDIETATGKIAAWKDFLNGEVVPFDNSGHGSHVNGIVFGRTGVELQGEPFQGMAPRGRIYVGRVLGGNATGLFSDVQAGIEWCAGFAADSPFPPADIINMSLGGVLFDGNCDGRDITGTAAVVNAAAASGVLLVAAAGNEAQYNAVSTPACASGAMAVGATHDEDVGGLILGDCDDPVTAPDRLACFSNRSSQVEVVAPGCLTHSASDITSFLLEPRCGTSMSSAHVAGVAALVMGANRLMTADEVRTRIRDTALDLGSPGWDRAHGHGRVDAGLAADGDNCFPDETVEATCGDGFDNDCDRLIDCADPDCCGVSPCNDIDADGDGLGACDCDDAQGTAWAPSGPARDLEIAADGSLTWSPPAVSGSTSGLLYDTLISPDPLDFFVAASCLESNGADTFTLDASTPAAGGILFYRVRPENACSAAGSLGNDSDGVARIGLPCP